MKLDKDRQQYVKQALELIKQGWIQQHFARNAVGDVVASTSSNATCFCLVGALNRVTERDEPSRAVIKNALRQKAFPEGNDVTLTEWNDEKDRTQNEVVQLLESVL